MSRGIGGRRPPEEWASAHERARVRISERLTEPLEPAEATWLEAHLLDCAACRQLDAAYRRDRDLLRTLRVVPPPRDLWARTSAAIEEESAHRLGVRRRPAAARRADWRPFGALGAIAAVVVAGFIIGSTIVGGHPTPPVALTSPGSSAGGSLPLVSTPIPVPVAQVEWGTKSDAGFTFHRAPVKQVCASDAPDCAPIDTNTESTLTVPVDPRSIHASVTSGQMVVFGQESGSTGVSMFVVTFAPAQTPTPTPSAPAPSGSPAVSSSPGGSPSTPPTTRPSVTPSGSPAESPAVTQAPPSSAPPASPTPVASATQVASPVPSPTASIVPGQTPAATAATVLAVASDLTVIGASSAAFSTDGTWFAFTARAASDAQGSDIYLWHVGAPQAVPLTTDHRSVFGGWANDLLVGSRADLPADPNAIETNATSFVVDPATLTSVDLAVKAWRPAVDPSGRWAVYWDGTVAVDPATGMWRSATGRLVIGSWPAMAAPNPEPSPSVEPSASPSVEPSADASSPTEPSASASASVAPSESTAPSPEASTAPSESAAASPIATPTASPTGRASLPTDLADPSGVDWQVAWDELGIHVAIWIGDRADSSFGHLDLIAIDPATGTFDPAATRLRDQPALPGLALSDGQLVWATPPGQDATGSHLEIYNYSGPDVGKTKSQSATGSDVVIVVQH